MVAKAETNVNNSAYSTKENTYLIFVADNDILKRIPHNQFVIEMRLMFV